MNMIFVNKQFRSQGVGLFKEISRYEVIRQLIAYINFISKNLLTNINLVFFYLDRMINHSVEFETSRVSSDKNLHFRLADKPS